MSYFSEPENKPSSLQDKGVMELTSHDSQDI